MFIILDLAQGYLLIPIHPKDRHKTAFINPEETVLFYKDDVLVPGRDWIDLKEKLILVVGALRKGGLTVKLRMYEFLKTRVDCLGFVISDNRIETGARKLRALEDFPRPTK